MIYADLIHAKDLEDSPENFAPDYIVPLAPPQVYDTSNNHQYESKNDEDDSWLFSSEMSRIYPEIVLIQAAKNKREPNYDAVVNLLNQKYHEWLDSMFAKTSPESIRAYIALYFTSNIILEVGNLAAQDAVKSLSREITIDTACQTVREFAEKSSWKMAIGLAGKPVKGINTNSDKKFSLEEQIKKELYKVAYDAAKKMYDITFLASTKNRSTTARVSAQLAAERASLIYLYENFENILDSAYSMQDEAKNPGVFLRKLKKLRRAVKLMENPHFTSSYALVWYEYFQSKA